MPGPDPPRPALRQVALAQHRAEGQHAVVAVEVEAADGLRVAHRPVVGVVEQEREAPARRPAPAEGGDEVGLVPLVDQDEVGPVQRPVEVREGAGVGLGLGQVGVGLAPAPERRLALVADQVLAAPAGGGLEDPDLVAAGAQLAHDAAQEVGVAVVPAGGQRVAEDHHPHAARLRATRRAARRSP